MANVVNALERCRGFVVCFAFSSYKYGMPNFRLPNINNSWTKLQDNLKTSLTCRCFTSNKFLSDFDDFAFKTLQDFHQDKPTSRLKNTWSPISLTQKIACRANRNVTGRQSKFRNFGVNEAKISFGFAMACGVVTKWVALLRKCQTAIKRWLCPLQSSVERLKVRQ